jgi:hypothetical protein
VEPYHQRKRAQDEKVSNLNKYTQYKKIILDIEEKLLELKKIASSKKWFEKEHKGEEDIMEHIETVQGASQL